MLSKINGQFHPPEFTQNKENKVRDSKNAHTALQYNKNAHCQRYIDCLTYAILSNHFHSVLRSRPDVVKVWSDEEVARRWLRLYPKRRDSEGKPEEPSLSEIGIIVNDPSRLAEIRKRLSDVSWWMKELAENIAKRSNFEENCLGRFWQGRFDCTILLDETSLLACSMYADLNPVRAAMAETPEESEYTGAKDRIDDLLARPNQEQLSEHEWEHNGAGHNGAGSKSGWMSPIEIDECLDPLGPDLDSTGRRASNKGFLSISATQYLELLDWTGRSIRDDKRGAIPQHLAPILTRIGLDTDRWCKIVARFGKLFMRAAGTTDNLAAEAERRGMRWLQGPGAKLLSPAPS